MGMLKIKVGDVFPKWPELGEQPHKVVEVTPEGRIALVTYLWPYDFPISDEEKAARAAIYEQKEMRGYEVTWQS
jgi:hypothetical protein